MFAVDLGFVSSFFFFCVCVCGVGGWVGCFVSFYGGVGVIDRGYSKN